MKRREWIFERSATDLAEAARSRVEYHGERLTWWELERERADDALKSKGVQVRSHAVTGGERHEAILDPTLAGRLGECETKIRYHRGKSDEYAQWIRALDSAAGRSLTLDHDDWIFFFGLRGDEDE